MLLTPDMNPGVGFWGPGSRGLNSPTSHHHSSRSYSTTLHALDPCAPHRPTQTLQAVPWETGRGTQTPALGQAVVLHCNAAVEG